MKKNEEVYWYVYTCGTLHTQTYTHAHVRTTEIKI